MDVELQTQAAAPPLPPRPPVTTLVGMGPDPERIWWSSNTNSTNTVFTTDINVKTTLNYL